MTIAEQFDSFIRQLQAAVRPGGGDAIDRELASEPRATAAVNLTDDPAIVAFRNELIDGLIRVDTARQFLSLMQTVIGLLIK